MFTMPRFLRTCPPPTVNTLLMTHMPTNCCTEEWHTWKGYVRTPGAFALVTLIDELELHRMLIHQFACLRYWRRAATAAGRAAPLFSRLGGNLAPPPCRTYDQVKSMAMGRFEHPAYSRAAPPRAVSAWRRTQRASSFARLLPAWGGVAQWAQALTLLACAARQPG